VALSPCLSAVPAGAYAAAQCGAGVRVGCPGGDYQRVLQQGVDPLLAAAGLVPVYDGGSSLGMQTKLRAEAGGRQSTLDVVLMPASAMYQTHAEGGTAAVDPANVPNLAHLLAPLKSDYAVAQAFTGLVLIYGEDRFKTPPTGLDVLLDPASKGRVALGRDLSAVLPLAGALAAGKTPGDPEAAAAFLQQLKEQAPSIHASPDTLAADLKSGKAWVALAWKADMLGWKKKGPRVTAIVPKEGLLANVFQAAITAGSRNQACAAAYLNALLDPAAQRAFAQGLGYAPVVADAGLAPELQEEVGVAGADLDRLVRLDQALLQRNRAALADSWHKAFGAAM
jgi:putative spermidine/putrescine transport system substrate-binding protein